MDVKLGELSRMLQDQAAAARQQALRVDQVERQLSDVLQKWRAMDNWEAQKDAALDRIIEDTGRADVAALPATAEALNDKETKRMLDAGLGGILCDRAAMDDCVRRLQEETQQRANALSALTLKLSEQEGTVRHYVGQAEGAEECQSTEMAL